MLAGVNVLDVSTDSGGGIWAVSASTVYYFPPGATHPITYDQSKGLARGWYTWQDPYFNGTPESPASLPVTFSAVAGATPGQAVVGNIGAIADRLTVDPKSGAIKNIENLAITHTTTPDAFYDDHMVRVIATHKIIAELEGPLNGTAYIGGWHGFTALHGLNGACGCKSDFEEHQHYFPTNASQCDSSGAQFGCWDGDVWGLAMSPKGDVWAGDRHFVQLLQQGSLGPNAGLFSGGFVIGIDVFPGLRDEVHGLAVDVAGGVWVASDGNGLAYLTPDTWKPMYWSASTTLPQNHLRGVAIDQTGDVWLGTDSAGLARYNGATNHWTYYSGGGLTNDSINTVYVDQFVHSRRLLIATQSGVTIYEGR
jgi:streptogramin lyase